MFNGTLGMWKYIQYILIEIIFQTGMFVVTYIYKNYTKTFLINMYNFWFYWDFSKSKMTMNGEPHIFHILNQKYICYIF